MLPAGVHGNEKSLQEHALVTSNGGSWPYFHSDPPCVVLAPRPDTTPSTLPPVRIFLGTQPEQYRAERIFFWSIEQVRDPARTYEIHLMTDLAGFDRKGWRTGFTKYRFAIPELAGGQGKAIYNDVDQIYLADPALLFDMDMQGHGYLAITPEETSVMLIDCQKMLPLWNRATANREGKHALIKKPAKTPGLWGEIDGHWNARDMEYAEGQTKCLHYTALHQQPWEPTPEAYSYHANALGYVWHHLERSADQAGYQVFTADSPSPDYLRLVRGNEPLPAVPAAPVPEAARRLLAEVGAASLLAVGFGARPQPMGLGPDLAVTSVDLARPEEVAAQTDAVLASGLLEWLPTADIAWVLDGLFAQAGKAVIVQVHSRAAEGMASAAWWERRIREAAARHPGVSWYLDATPDPRFASTGPTQTGVRRLGRPGASTVWVLATGDTVHDRHALALAERLGMAFEVKKLRLNGRRKLPQALLGASLASLDRDASDQLAPPWPDLVIACGRKTVPVARWIRQQAGEGTRLVHIGRPYAAFALFDLIIAWPQSRLPIRDNVMQAAAPLVGIAPERLAAAASDWSPRLQHLPRPWTAVFLGAGKDGLVVDAGVGNRLAELVAADAAGGSVLLAVAPRTPLAARAAFEARVGVPVHAVTLSAESDAHAAFLALADQIVVTGDDYVTLAEAASLEKPVAYLPLRHWWDRLPGGRQLVEVGKLVAGGGTSYRGTPHQQHFLSRGLDALTVAGLRTPSRDIAALQRSLLARGLVGRLDHDEVVSSPKPLDDLDLAAERVMGLLSERRLAG